MKGTLSMIDVVEIVKQFCIEGEIKSIKSMNSGHINTTFRITFNNEGRTEYYTAQAINTYVFKNPEAVMDNIVKVTNHIRKKLEESGGNLEREVLTPIQAKDGKYFYVDIENTYWRIYHFIDKSHTHNKVEDPMTLYSAGECFGNFQKQLADFPMDELVETIPDFHNTPVRYDQLMEAIERNSAGRADRCMREIKFFLDREKEMSILTNLQADGKLPLRVTHNDTKFNNILLDDETNKAISVIDLDTVMPGLVTSDFGDAIRFAANMADEDETDLSKVEVSLELFEAFTKGFLTALDGRLTETEMLNLVWGAKIMTMECGMRFLADYINGDVYFKIHREHHNLDRARNQIALTKSIEAKFDKLQAIVKKYM